MKLSELLTRRATLAAKSSELAAQSAKVSEELAAIDAQLFRRMKTLVDAIEGSETPETVVSGAELDVTPHPVQAMLPGTFAFGAEKPRGLRPRRQPSPLTQAMISAMRAIGRPASRNEIYDAIISSGGEVPGKDPKANLSAHLSYSEAVERLADGTWRLKTRAEGAERQTPAGAGV